MYITMLWKNRTWEDSSQGDDRRQHTGTTHRRSEVEAEGEGLRQYRRADVDAAMEVGRAPEGVGLGQYRRADVGAIEVRRAPQGGGPRQYRRVEVEGGGGGAHSGVQPRGTSEDKKEGQEGR